MSIIKSNMTAPPPSTGGALSSISEMNSLRFDGSSYLSRTFGSPTNGSKWVYSYWQKDKAQSNRGCTLSAGNYGYGTFITYENEWFRFGRYYGGYTWIIETNQVFRDPSAWRHIVITWDTSLSSNQVKIYVNGALASLRSNSQPTAAGDINASGIHKIGVRVYDNTLSLDGYLANIHFIDGQDLTPTAFGEEISGVWVPKAYGSGDPTDTATVLSEYGQNGFHLTFEDGIETLNVNGSNVSAFRDKSGRDNHWQAH